MKKLVLALVGLLGVAGVLSFATIFTSRGLLENAMYTVPCKRWDGMEVGQVSACASLIRENLWCEGVMVKIGPAQENAVVFFRWVGDNDPEWNTWHPQDGTTIKAYFLALAVLLRNA